MSLRVKSIRLIPILLIMLLAVSNLFLGYITYPGITYTIYLIFALIYLALGVLFISKFRFAEMIGLIITVIIFFIYPMLSDLKNLHPWSAGVLSAINGIIFISCFILLILKIKE
jgi:hypothetical protein